MTTINQALRKDVAHVGDLLKANSGDLGTIEGIANLKNALFHRLVTVPGTLVHRPDYGVGIGNYQNAPSSFSLQQTLAAKIAEQFELDPRVQSVSGVSINAPDDGNPQNTTIVVRVIPVGYTEVPMTFTPFGAGL